MSIEEEKEPKILVNAVIKPTVDSSQIGAASKQKRTGLFLKFKSKNDENIAKVKEILQDYKGDFPMYYYLDDEKKYIKAQSYNFVKYDDNLVKTLKNILGEGNVAVRF